MQKLVTAYILFFFCSFAYAQTNTLTYTTIEKNTYALYCDSNWTTLIQIGKQALNHAIDYYYLRMRIGIAYFSKHQYLYAIKHFEKALDFNPNDAIALEYLYYSYIYANRRQDAIMIIKQMPETLKQKIGYKDNFINNLYIESGYVPNSAYSKLNETQYQGPTLINVRKTVQKYLYYYSIGLTHKLSSKIQLFHSYTNSRIFNQVTQYETTKTFEFEQPILQNQYYILLNYHLRKATNLNIAFHYINDDLHFINNEIKGMHFTNIQSHSTINNYILFFGIEKYFSIVKPMFSCAYSFINNQYIFQSDVGMYIYFKGTNRLITYTQISNHYISSNNKYTPIIKQTLTINPIKNFWFEINYTGIDIYNYSENDAYIIYNNTDKIKHRIGSVLYFNLPKLKTSLSLRYYYLVRQSSNLFYEENNLNTYNFDKYNKIQYINHSLIGGILWNF